MTKMICSLITVAGLAAAVNAGTSRLGIQVSKDGVSWSNAVTVNHNAGDSGRVLVRYSMNWIVGDEDTIVPVGFASATFQPTFANVRDGDVIAPFVGSGSNRNGGSVELDASPLDGPFGRIRPFANTGPVATRPASIGNRYAAILHTDGSGGAPAGSHYRIARNDVTRWMGTGPTSGSSAVNNFNGAGGVAAVQWGSGLVGPLDPPFDTSIENVVLMQIAIDVAAVGSGQSHTIDLDIPLAGVGGRNAITGLSEAAWFSDSADPFGRIKGVIFIDQAQINIIPAPGALGLLALGGVVASRRRRCGVICSE